MHMFLCATDFDSFLQHERIIIFHSLPAVWLYSYLQTLYFQNSSEVFLSYFRNVKNKRKTAGDSGKRSVPPSQGIQGSLHPNNRNRVSGGTVSIEGEGGWMAGSQLRRAPGVDSTSAARGKHSSHQNGCQVRPVMWDLDEFGNHSNWHLRGQVREKSMLPRPACSYLFAKCPTQTQLFTGVGLMRAGTWLETFSHSAAKLFKSKESF